MNAYVSASVSRMSDGGDGGVGHKPRGRGFYDRGSNADPSNADIDFSSNHRRNRSVPKRSQPLRFSSTGCESSIGLQNKSRESRYSSCAPIRKVATECDGHPSNGRRRSSCKGESNDEDDEDDDDDSGFNEEDYLAGRIFTGLVSNRLLVKSSSPPVDTLFNKPDISKKSESQKMIRSASATRMQDVVFKPYEQQSVRDKGRTNKLQHDGIYSKQSNCYKPNSGGRLDQRDYRPTDVRAHVRPGSSQTNNAGQVTNSIPKFCAETKERQEITKHVNSINENKPNRFKTGSSPNYNQGDRISTKMAHAEDKSDREMHGRGRQTSYSDRPEKNNDENGNRKHKSNDETNPDDHASQEIHNATNRTGKSSKDNPDSENDDTDKVYNYFLYIGTRIPSKSFSRLSRSVNKQTTLVPS